MSWSELYEWIAPELGHGGAATPPLRLVPCSLPAWKDALTQRAAREDVPRDVARLAMLLPSIEGELAAEGEQLWVLVQQIFPLFPGCFNLSVSPSVNFVSLTPPFPFDALSII